MRRLLIIGFIWVGCAIAWMVLGTTVVVRSGGTSSALQDEVNLLWGPSLVQQPPRALYRESHSELQTVREVDNQGNQVSHQVEHVVTTEFPVPLDGSDIDASLQLAQRKKGLLWFPTYGVDFHARYVFTNPDPAQSRLVEMRFPLMAGNSVYDGFNVKDAKGKALSPSFEGDAAVWSDTFAPGEQRTYALSYRSRGTTRWTYQLTQGTAEVRHFSLALTTNFENVDFPAGTLSPTEHSVIPGGWRGAWRFESLVANGQVGLLLPQRLNPGELASKITYFAPVGLLFFFFVVAVLAAARKVSIHPLNYFLFGCAFFAFHLLFAYLVDQVDIFPAFALASLVSLFLVASYARLFVGWTFALREMAISQVLYLVLFSFTFFWTGFTGLAITVGAILTLFVIMQITGRVDWHTLVDPS